MARTSEGGACSQSDAFQEGLRTTIAPASSCWRAQIELRRQIEALAAQRRALPAGGEVAEDYLFDEWDARVGTVRHVRHSELFEAGRDDLFIYSFMFKPGPHGQPLEVPCPEQFAMATTFQRRGATIRHVWSSELWDAPPEEGQNPRHVDFMWPMWSVIDRTAAGRGEWMPKLSYDRVG